METLLSVNYDGVAHQFKIISSLYLEEPAWIVHTGSGKELILFKQKGAWRGADDSDYDKHLIKAIGEAIDLARKSRKVPFATFHDTAAAGSVLKQEWGESFCQFEKLCFRGKVNQKVLPFPYSLSTHIRPWCRSVISLQI